MKINLSNYKVNDCTHKLKCVHAIGQHRLYYYMPCIPISNTKSGKTKIIVFGDRYWREHIDTKHIRYVDPLNLLRNDQVPV